MEYLATEKGEMNGSTGGGRKKDGGEREEERRGRRGEGRARTLYNIFFVLSEIFQIKISLIIGLHFQLCQLRVHRRSEDNLSCIPDSMWNRNYHFHLFSIIEVHFSFCSVHLSRFRVWDYNFKSEIFTLLGSEFPSEYFILKSLTRRSRHI